MIARPLAFATGAVCLATLLAYGGRWRTAGAAAIGLALNVWPMYGAFFGAVSPPTSNARVVRVASFNVNIANDKPHGIAAYLESQAVDIAVLQELSPANAERLAALLRQLPHRYLAGHDGVWGVAILSRWPLIAPQPAAQDGLTFAARADVDLGDRRFPLYGAHLHWPVMPAAARVRNTQLLSLSRELSECAHACVVVGDFNVTPWSSHFRDVLRSPDVHDCAAGRGLLATWSSSLRAAAHPHRSMPHGRRGECCRRARR